MKILKFVLTRLADNSIHFYKITHLIQFIFFLRKQAVVLRSLNICLFKKMYSDL